MKTKVLLVLALLSSITCLALPQSSASSAGVSFELVASRGYAYEGSSTNYYIVEGVVRNTGTQNATNIYVRVRIYWSGGTLKGESTDGTYLAILEVWPKSAIGS